MEIKNAIRYVNPLGFMMRMYISEFELHKLFNLGLISPCSYDLVLYGIPLIQEFVYDVNLSRFASFLLKPKNFFIYD